MVNEWQIYQYTRFVKAPVASARPLEGVVCDARDAQGENNVVQLVIRIENEPFNTAVSDTEEDRQFNQPALKNEPY